MQTDSAFYEHENENVESIVSRQPNKNKTKTVPILRVVEDPFAPSGHFAESYILILKIEYYEIFWQLTGRCLLRVQTNFETISWAASNGQRTGNMDDPLSILPLIHNN